MRTIHHGLKQVISYNWPYYLVAILGCAAAGWVIATVDLPPPLRTIAAIGLAAGACWLIAGTIAVWYVFDRSPLTRWLWIPDVLQVTPKRWGNLHAGGDEATPTLRRLYPDAVGDEIDFFDSALVTEPSLQRLRKARPADALNPAIHIDEWTPEGARWDVAFLILAAHEVRAREGRAALLARIRCGLLPGGKLLLVEHLRDFANFLVFGPAFIHFFSDKEWRLAAQAAGFKIARRTKITPFVHAIVLESVA